MFMRRAIFSAFATLAAFCMASPAGATPLLPGTVVVPGVDATTGTVIASVTDNFSFDSDTGTVREDVIRKGDGTLAFAYQINLTGSTNPASQGDIARMTLTNFSGVTTDVTQSLNGLAGVSGSGFVVGTKASLTADRSGGTGAAVGFNFNRFDFVAPSISLVQVISTNATSYRVGNIGLIDGATGNFAGFGAAPEPSSMALAGLGAIGLIGYGLRRRKARTA
jgi:hypothetical protein